MPKPKKTLELNIMEIASDLHGAFTCTGLDIMRSYFNEKHGDEMRDLRMKGDMLADLVNENNPHTALQYQDPEEQENALEEYDLHGSSAGETQVDPYSALEGKYKKKQTFLKEKTYDELKKSVKEYTDSVKALLDTDDGKEFKEKYPNSYAYIAHGLKEYEDFLNDKNRAETYRQIPGAKWFYDNSADYRPAQINGYGEHIQIPSKDIEKALAELHYAEIDKNFREQIEINEKLEDPSLSEEQHAELIEEQKKHIKKTVEEGNRLASEKTVNAVTFFFENAAVNLGGDRGAKEQMAGHADKALQIIENGWDANNVFDAPMIVKLAGSCKNMAKETKKIKGFEEFTKKAEAVAGFDPYSRIYHSRAEYVEYCQKFSDAVNDFLSECNKPETKKLLKQTNEKKELSDQRIRDAQEKLTAAKNELKAAPANAKLSGKVKLAETELANANKEAVPAIPMALAMLNDPPSRAERSRLRTDLEFFANKLNFRSRGITATAQGELIYDEKKLDEMEATYRSVNEQAKEIAPVVKDFYKQFSDVPSGGDQEYVDLKNALKNISAMRPDTACYCDMELRLKELSEKAAGYSEANPGTAGIFMSDRANENTRRSLAKQIKTFADNQLTSLYSKYNKDMNVYRSAGYMADDIQHDREMSKNFVKVGNELTGYDNYIDYTSLQNASIPLNTLSSPFTVYAGEQFADPQKKEEFSTELVIKTMPSSWDTHGEHGRKDYELFSRSGSETVRYANTPEARKEAKAACEYADGLYAKMLATDYVKSHPAASAVLKFHHSFVTSAMQGVDKYKYFSRVPGALVAHMNPNWRETNNGENFSADEFDDMLKGMGYDKIIANVDEHISILAEMDNAVLTDEQRKDYSRRILELNNEKLAVFENMMSPDKRKKYEKFYQNGNFDRDVLGDRGVPGDIARIKAQNQAIINGWDVAKLHEYTLLQSQVKIFDDAIKLCEAGGGTLGLDNLGKIAKHMKELEPAKQKFTSQAEFDAYYLEYAKKSREFTEEIKKPEVQASLKKAEQWVIVEEEELLHDVERLLDAVEAPALKGLKATTKKLTSLDPTERTFVDEKAMDDHLVRVNNELFDFNKQMQEPKVQAALEKMKSPEVRAKLDNLDPPIHFSIIEKMKDIYSPRKMSCYSTSAKNTVERLKYVADNCTDLTKSRLKGTEAEIAKRKADIATADRLKDVNLCVKETDAIAKQAKVMLDGLTSLDGQRKQNSKLYTDMKDALIRVACLEGSDFRTADVTEALSELNKASAKYSSERSGRFKSEQGQSRVDMADKLKDFTVKALDSFNSAAKPIKGVEKEALGVRALGEKYREKLGVEFSADAVKEQGLYGVSIENLCMTTDYSLNKIKKQLDFIKEDNQTRKKPSESYKEFADAVLTLNGDIDYRERLNPKQLSEALNKLIKASDKYIEEHTGRHIFSGNKGKGEERLESAKKISQTMKKELEYINRMMSGLPKFGENETLSSKKQECDSKYNTMKESLDNREQIRENDRKAVAEHYTEKKTELTAEINSGIEARSKERGAKAKAEKPAEAAPKEEVKDDPFDIASWQEKLKKVAADGKKPADEAAQYAQIKEMEKCVSAIIVLTELDNAVKHGKLSQLEVMQRDIASDAVRFSEARPFTKMIENSMARMGGADQWDIMNDFKAKALDRKGGKVFNEYLQAAQQLSKSKNRNSVPEPVKELGGEQIKRSNTANINRKNSFDVK